MSFFIVKKNKSGSQKKPLFIVIRAADIQTAVKRNVLKRQIRTIVQRNKKNTTSGYDYKIIVKKGGDMLSFEQIKREIEPYL
ncbi:MAG: ribonuclease P protein component [Patescibacteria group bacterium]